MQTIKFWYTWSRLLHHCVNEMPSLGLVVEPVVFNTTVFDLEKDNENDVGNITGGKKREILCWFNAPISLTATWI